MARITKEAQRLLVAQGLLSLKRVDILSESALVQTLAITPASSTYWAEGQELARQLVHAALTTIKKLEVRSWRVSPSANDTATSCRQSSTVPQ